MSCVHLVKKMELLSFLKNDTTYMGDDMIDSVDKPIKCKDNYVIVGLCQKVYYPNNNKAQSITFSGGNSIPVEYNGVLPCIAVYKSTKYRVENCEGIALTSKFDWGPYGKGGSLS